jgi:hypothetical protein
VGSRSPETQIKRARELALKERRERKQAKKDARAAERLRALEEPAPELDENGEPIEPGELEDDAVKLEDDAVTPAS